MLNPKNFLFIHRRRRVIEKLPNKKHETFLVSFEAKRDFTIAGLIKDKTLFIGLSLTNPLDSFSRKDGRKFAMYRAVLDPTIIRDIDTESEDPKDIRKAAIEEFVKAADLISKDHKEFSHLLKPINEEKFMEFFGTHSPDFLKMLAEEDAFVTRAVKNPILKEKILTRLAEETEPVAV